MFSKGFSFEKTFSIMSVSFARLTKLFYESRMGLYKVVVIVLRRNSVVVGGGIELDIVIESRIRVNVNIDDKKREESELNKVVY